MFDKSFHKLPLYLRTHQKIKNSSQRKSTGSMCKIQWRSTKKIPKQRHRVTCYFNYEQRKSMTRLKAVLKPPKHFWEVEKHELAAVRFSCSFDLRVCNSTRDNFAANVLLWIFQNFPIQFFENIRSILFFLAFNMFCLEVFTKMCYREYRFPF